MDGYAKALTKAKELFRQIAERSNIDWTDKDDDAVSEIIHLIISAVDDRINEQISNELYR